MFPVGRRLIIKMAKKTLYSWEEILGKSSIQQNNSELFNGIIALIKKLCKIK